MTETHLAHCWHVESFPEMLGSRSVRREMLWRGEVGYIGQTFLRILPPLPGPHWQTRSQIAQLLLASVSIYTPQEGVFWGGGNGACH